MPRKMSCFKTIDAVRRRDKTVTRRIGWWFLNPGDIVDLVEKAQGLKKGEKMVHLATVEIVSTRAEELCTITWRDVAREGFRGYGPEWFVDMFMQLNDCSVDGPLTVVNRIEWRYLN